MSNENNTGISLRDLMSATGFDAERHAEGVKALKKNKINLLSAAENFNSRYQQEIEEGTKKRQLLLQNGQARGLSEDQIFENNASFFPTRQTPILNFLYFLMREHPHVNDDLTFLREAQYSHQKHEDLVENLNHKYGHLIEEYVKSDMVKDTPDVKDYIYDNIDIDTFNKIKKLKSLSRSPNKEEAFLAYTKCNELCEKYNLEFDRIPCNVPKR